MISHDSLLVNESHLKSSDVQLDLQLEVFIKNMFRGWQSRFMMTQTYSCLFLTYSNLFLLSTFYLFFKAQFKLHHFIKTVLNMLIRRALKASVALFLCVGHWTQLTGLCYLTLSSVFVVLTLSREGLCVRRHLLWCHGKTCLWKCW